MTSCNHTTLELIPRIKNRIRREKETLPDSDVKIAVLF